MKETYKTIEYEWLTRTTGDPFADAGGFAIEYLSEKFPEKDIIDLIDYITKIYVEKWNGKLNAFFLNSKITQPAFQGQRKIDETLKYYKGLIEETEPYEIGFCRISGRKTKLFCGGRDNSIMTGSGTLINFHPFFQKGIALSKEVIIRMHFIPFACQQLQGKIYLIQSNNQELSKLFVKLTVDKNLHEIGLGISDGVARSDFGKPANAVFGFADQIITKINYLQEWEVTSSITLYHFTNFGASPEIQIYQLPAKIFHFYGICLQPKYNDEWKKFVKSHYFDSKHKGAQYNSQTGNIISKSKSNELEIVDPKEYRQWFNVIYNKLLVGDNIRSEILRWSRNNALSFEIVEIYQQYIIGMKKETIEKIKELAMFLVREEDADIIKRRIKVLDGIKNASVLRRFLLKNVVVANFSEGIKEPILTLEDYVNYLFPDGSYWSEIRDLLLIAIYQELHKRNLVSDELKNVDLTDDFDNELTNK